MRVWTTKQLLGDAVDVCLGWAYLCWMLGRNLKHSFDKSFVSSSFSSSFGSRSHLPRCHLFLKALRKKWRAIQRLHLGLFRICNLPFDRRLKRCGSIDFKLLSCRLLTNQFLYIPCRLCTAVRMATDVQSKL